MIPTGMSGRRYTENLIFYLSNSEVIKTREAESINTLLQSKNLIHYTSLTPSVASAISVSLNANVFIYGNIQQAGSKVRVNAKLIDSKTEDVIRSFQIEGPSREEIIFNISDSLSRMVKDFLIISILKKDNAEYQDITLTNHLKPRYYLLVKVLIIRKIMMMLFIG
jgi:TolB-like protein